MKNIAFVGHSHHAITKSSHFFKRHLVANYSVDDFSIDPNETWEENASQFSKILSGDYDGIVLWQIDYLASFFLRRGIPVIICPMYDSSSVLEPSHWTALKDALIICFSLELQWIIAKAGVDSIYVKYFPPLKGLTLNEDSSNDPDSLAKAHVSTHAKESPLKVFFWERLPDSTITSENVIRLLSKLRVDNLHIHQAPDPGRTSSKVDQDLSLFPITTSNWFDSPDEYHKILESADLFVAPRYSEGIGMSFLEAMGHGCCVIAHDMATHNEYIKNWDTGILVNFLSEISPLTAEAGTIRDIGLRARKNSRLLRKNWEEFYLPQVLSSIEDYLTNFNATPKGRASTKYQRQEVESELQHLFAAHNNWEKYYSWLEKIIRSSSTLSPTENGQSIIARVIELELVGDYQAAFSILESAIKTHQSSSVYTLFKNQLSDRIALRESHERRRDMLQGDI